MEKTKAIPDDYIGIDEFAKRANLTVPEVVQIVRDGHIVGQKIAGEWYIKINKPASHEPPEFSYNLWIRQISNFRAGWPGFVVALVALGFVVLTVYLLLLGDAIRIVSGDLYLTAIVFSVPAMFGGTIGYFLAARLFYSAGKRRYEKMISR